MSMSYETTFLSYEMIALTPGKYLFSCFYQDDFRALAERVVSFAVEIFQRLKKRFQFFLKKSSEEKRNCLDLSKGLNY